MVPFQVGPLPTLVLVAGCVGGRVCASGSMVRDARAGSACGCVGVGAVRSVWAGSDCDCVSGRAVRVVETDGGVRRRHAISLAAAHAHANTHPQALSNHAPTYAYQPPSPKASSPSAASVRLYATFVTCDSSMRTTERARAWAGASAACNAALTPVRTNGHMRVWHA